MTIPPNVTREDREQLNGQRGRVVWFTGLSGAGKSTLANALAAALHARGELPHMTGIDSPYEPPEAPRIALRTDEVALERNVEELLKILAA